MVVSDNVCIVLIPLLVQLSEAEALEQQLPYFSGSGDTSAAAYTQPELLATTRQHWRSLRRQNNRVWGEWMRAGCTFVLHTWGAGKAAAPVEQQAHIDAGRALAVLHLGVGCMGNLDCDITVMLALDCTECPAFGATMSK